MSILLYAKAPQVRRSIAAALPGGATPPAVTSIAKYSEALAALVPAEALALHAAILAFTTSTTRATTTITDSAVGSTTAPPLASERREHLVGVS